MITTAIPVQRFEEVRNKIGEIITAELSNQATLINDPRLNATIWVERMAPFTSDEMPAINVGFISSENIEYSAVHANYECKYYIDVHNRAEAKTENGVVMIGDVESQIVLQRICGIVRSILTHPLYKTLGFADAFIETRNVESVMIADPQSDDSNFISTARIVFMVRLVERNTAESAVLSTGNTTNIRLEMTERGYKFELNN